MHKIARIAPGPKPKIALIRLEWGLTAACPRGEFPTNPVDNLWGSVGRGTLHARNRDLLHPVRNL